ncbi:MAG: FAD-dependent oxidoreductase [Deinococcota bacterium]|nr:FAD-dependent oxidoreductase [Deinococcota bacterium]
MTEPVTTSTSRGHTLQRSYDLVVVGAGVSGSELAWAAARGGLDTLLVTTSMDTVYNLLGDGVVLRPPSGTLMAELHAQEARGAGDSYNDSYNDSYSGGYVTTWGFHRRAKYALEHCPNLHLLQSNVSALIGESEARGVNTWEGVDRLGARVALCVGSFLRARLSIGTLTEAAGRLSEMAYDDLYDDLVARGFAFEDERLEAAFDDGSLPYRVDCRRFALAEWDGEAFRLPRLAGLYAAGVCASGYLTYEEAAAQGRALAQRIVSSG